MLAHLKKSSSVIDHTAECICPNFNLVVRSMRRQATTRSFPTDPKSQLSKSSAGPISLITNSSTSDVPTDWFSGVYVCHLKDSQLEQLNSSNLVAQRHPQVPPSEQIFKPCQKQIKCHKNTNKTTFFDSTTGTAPSSQILRSFAKTLHIVLALVSLAFSAGELVYLLMLKVRASWQNQTKQEFISWISLFEPTQSERGDKRPYKCRQCTFESTEAALIRWDIF